MAHTVTLQWYLLAMDRPGFRAVLAPTLTPLRDHFLERVAAAPLPPLETEIIFVQSLGMRHWLTLQLANRFGCAGSVAMPFPRDLLTQAARWAKVDLPGHRHFSREALTWRLESLLRTLDTSDPVFAPLATYLRDGDPRMRSGLAIRVAGRFDDYQLFRPDLVATWDTGARATDNPHEAWQAALWRALAVEPDAPHGARHLDRVLQRLRETHTTELAIPPRLTAFGISALPPRYLELLSALGQHSDVTLYAAVPPTGAHPLEARLGGQGRVLPQLLATCGAEIIRIGTPLRVCAKVQAHVTHSAAREVEVIHDQLLDAFASDPSLQPEDVLVLVPDIDQWGGIVDTVFSTLRDGTQRIPVHLAYASRRTDPAVRAFGDLLALEGGRFTHSEVFSVLQHPLILSAAELTEDRLEALARRTHAANIRWGYDESSLASLDLPTDNMPTWREGLDRLLMGVVAGGADTSLLGVLPMAGATSGDPEALGALTVWVDRVAALLRDWKRPRTLATWSADLVRVAEEFLRGEDRDAQTARSKLLEQLRHVATDLPADAVTPIAFAVVREWLTQVLVEGEGSARGVTGSVTVAEWKPMRSIPFRVIAVAGLDDAAFPRRDRPVGFDLIAHAPQLGDRSLREDDRQLFLDIVTAASERLILSWSGWTATTATARARSVVLDELFEVLASEGRPVSLIEHPLHPFSSRYFSASPADATLFTYSDRMERTAIARNQSGQSKPALDSFAPTPIDARLLPQTDGVVQLEDLIAFWENPSRWFCRESLCITLLQDESIDADRERMALTKMEEGLIRYLMLRGTMRGTSDPDAERHRLIADGKLPPGELGIAWHTQLAAEFDLLRPRLPNVPMRSVGVSLQGSGWQLKGEIAGVTDEARYVIRSGDFHPKNRIRAWVEHVVLCAAAQTHQALPRTSVYVGLVKKKSERQLAEARVSEVSSAIALVDQWVRLLRTARTRPPAFFPQAAVAWIDAAVEKQAAGARGKKPPSDAERMQRARAAYAGDDYREGDVADAYIGLCFRDRDPFITDADEFIDMTLRLLTTRVSEPLSVPLPGLDK